jgi:hypothetical protein
VDGDPTGQIKTRHGILPAKRSNVLAKEKNLKRERRKIEKNSYKKMSHLELDRLDTEEMTRPEVL